MTIDLAWIYSRVVDRALRKEREEQKIEWKPQYFDLLGEDAYFLKEEILKQIPKARSRHES